MSRTPDPVGAVPAMSPALREALRDLQPVQTRQPRRQYLLLAVIAVGWLAATLAVTSLRRDLHDLPVWPTLGAGLVWAAAFASALWLALVPRPHEVMVRAREAGWLGLACAGGLLLMCLLVHPRAPTSSVLGWAQLGRGHGCLELGLVVAAVPVALTVWLLRRVMPHGARWGAFGIGAASGALGGLMLHLHCPIVDAPHLVFMHGGVVVVAALVTALVAPARLRP